MIPGRSTAARLWDNSLILMPAQPGIAVSARFIVLAVPGIPSPGRPGISVKYATPGHSIDLLIYRPFDRRKRNDAF